MIKVTIFNEFIHEVEQEAAKAVYPNGMHMAIKEFLDADGRFTVRTATLHEPEHGLTQEVLDDTDVLLWWGHCAHHLVDDAVVERVYERVLQGMGLIALHSGHFSKIIKRHRLQLKMARKRRQGTHLDYGALSSDRCRSSRIFRASARRDLWRAFRHCNAR